MSRISITEGMGNCNAYCVFVFSQSIVVQYEFMQSEFHTFQLPPFDIRHASTMHIENSINSYHIKVVAFVSILVKLFLFTLPKCLE